MKEFLTSDRVRTSEVTSIHLYHIPLDAAHTTLARACLTVLLQLDEKINRKRLLKLPLAFYAAQNWVGHAPYRDSKMPWNLLFDAERPHLAAWIWIHHVKWENKRTIDDLDQTPPSLEGTPLYYAVCWWLHRIFKAPHRRSQKRCKRLVWSLRISATCRIVSKDTSRLHVCNLITGQM